MTSPLRTPTLRHSMERASILRFSRKDMQSEIDESLMFGDAGQMSGFLRVLLLVLKRQPLDRTESEGSLS